MQAYGNLFQGRENVSYTAGKHVWKAGAEVRINRDTTYFGISPNGEYDFGGGTAYATEAIPPQSGKQTSIPAIRCPIRSPACSPAAPSPTPSPSPRRTFPTASTSVPPPSAATTSPPTSKTRGR